MAARARQLTRAEAKLVTRGRLLDAGLKVLCEEGYGALSASQVSRLAGIAQPTFYVHFKDKDDLVRALARERLGKLRGALREERGRLVGALNIEGIRETFRIPIRAMIENEELYRLYVQERYQPASPFGEFARELHAEIHQDLVEDFARMGFPSKTAREKAELEMISEAVIAMAERLGLLYVDGHYTDFEQVVDLLARFTVSVFPVGKFPRK